MADQIIVNTLFPIEHVGEVMVVDGVLKIGDDISIAGCRPGKHDVFMRRIGRELSLDPWEVIISFGGDRYFQEMLDNQNAEAGRYSLGPKEYWRSEMVGKWRDVDGDLMTNEEFEEYWEEDGYDDFDEPDPAELRENEEAMEVAREIINSQIPEGTIWLKGVVEGFSSLEAVAAELAGLADFLRQKASLGHVLESPVDNGYIEVSQFPR